MSNGLFIHYQWVRTKGLKERLTCHEACSDGERLIALNPVPIDVSDSDLEKMANTDLKRFGVLDFRDIQSHIERWDDMFELHEDAIPDYWDEDVTYDEDFLGEDYYDDSGKVIDLVDFFKKKGNK